MYGTRRNAARRHAMSRALLMWLALGLSVVATAAVRGQDRPSAGATSAPVTAAQESDPTDVLPAEEWERVDQSVDRALAWLISQQQPDGSFPSIETGQPGVTSLCLLAFLAHGHMPNEGRYGEPLARAVEFVKECQKPNGLIAQMGPRSSPISRKVG